MSEQKFDMKNLSEFHLDALREVGNIGAGHAAIAMTQFLNRSTYMSIPKVALDSVETISKFIKMPRDQELAIISSTTVSGLLYTLLVFLDNDSVQKIVDLMTKMPDSDSESLVELSPLFLSLIKETGSILLLKYVEALNYLLGANSFPSPPKLRIGPVSSLAKNELKQVGSDISSVLFIECDVFTSERNITVDLAIIPHKETFDQFMGSLFGEEG